MHSELIQVKFKIYNDSILIQNSEQCLYNKLRTKFNDSTINYLCPAYYHNATDYWI